MLELLQMAMPEGKTEESETLMNFLSQKRTVNDDDEMSQNDTITQQT